MLKAPLVVSTAVKRSQRFSHSTQKHHATKLFRLAAAPRTAPRPRPRAATARRASRPADAAPAPLAKVAQQKHASRTRSLIAVQRIDISPWKSRSAGVQATSAAHLVQGSEAGQTKLRPKHCWRIEIGQPAWREVLLLVEQPLAEALPRHLVLQGSGTFSKCRPAGADCISKSNAGRVCRPGSWKVACAV